MVGCGNNYDLLNYAELTTCDVNCTPFTLKSVLNPSAPRVHHSQCAL